jgi:hypothetical protein
MLLNRDRNNTINEKKSPTRYIKRQFNLIINNFMRESSFGTNSINTFFLRDFNQDNIQENKHQERREKEV